MNLWYNRSIKKERERKRIEMKKLYVIVEYDIRDDNYLSYAVDGIVFENKKTEQKLFKLQEASKLCQIQE